MLRKLCDRPDRAIDVQTCGRNIGRFSFSASLLFFCPSIHVVPCTATRALDGTFLHFYENPPYPNCTRLRWPWHDCMQLLGGIAMSRGLVAIMLGSAVAAEKFANVGGYMHRVAKVHLELLQRK